MARKKKPLNDSEIISLVQDSIQAGVKFTDSKLAAERRKVTDYYNGKLPKPIHGGNSSYVSTDVFDAVESTKATLLEAFSVGADIIQFSPKGAEDEREATIATAYTKHVVFEQNPGTDIMGSVIHDGLTCRLGVVKVYWDHQTEDVEETFEADTEDALVGLPDDAELRTLDVSDDGTVSGTIGHEVDRSQVRIEVLPPEEFIVNPSIKALDGTTPITHRTEKSKTELLNEGYPKALVEKICTSDTTLEFDQERIARFDPVGADSFGSHGDRQEATKPFVIYETYATLDIEQTGHARFWRIVHCGEVILEKERVDRHPFLTYAPLPVPHSLYGGNFAARVIPIQNAKTVLTRSILDHAVITNNPRYGVVRGSLTNPRELIDNRIGGLVNVTRSDGIFPLPQYPLNPHVFQTIAMLDEDKEDTTGTSRLSQGLNKDAISSQNSQGMVEQLIGASMQRQKTAARAFATQFLKPLFLEVYRLVVENEKQERIVAIAGDWVPVNPQDWARQRDVTVELRLGYGEKDKMAEEYLTLGQILDSDESIKPMYGPEERYNLYKKVMEVKGHKNVQEFLKRPDQVQPPQPDPMMAAELQLKQQELALNDRKQTLAEQKFMAEFNLEQMKADFDKRFAAMEYALKVQEEHRKEAETANKIEVANAEIELAEKELEKAPEENSKATAIISPNG